MDALIQRSSRFNPFRRGCDVGRTTMKNGTLIWYKASTADMFNVKLMGVSIKAFPIRLMKPHQFDDGELVDYI